MDKVRALWSDLLPEYPSAQIEEIKAAFSGELCSACCCFWLFRYLHRAENKTAVLVGDYSFGRFSAHLAAMDSVYFNSVFASFLKKDTRRAIGLRDYIDYIRNAVENQSDEH